MSTLATTNIKHPSSASNNIVLDSSARVGIGTASPAAKLHINNGTNENVHFATGGGGDQRIQALNDAGSTTVQLSIQAAPLLFRGGGGTERMRLSGTGEVFINTTTTNPGFGGDTTPGVYFGATNYLMLSRSGGIPLYVNRPSDDGTLVDFNQAGVSEGTISVSGTTVSYNGGHLSRWSQLPSGVEREEILRGSVLSNLDEMCEWGEEDNEQLNRMKVSDVEGDKNVSGVFQCWDDDDDTYTNDFYCAMTGDFIIRIAEGTPVHRGQLLMSAGDGTAKPQGDGYVQDKTIAKVTSTNVSCTYDDGSYCVPCVLMAC